MYRVLKVINNNALLAYDLHAEKEVIFLATGVGFGKKINTVFDDVDGAKKFYTNEKIKEVTQNVDPVYLEIADMILHEAELEFNDVDRMIQLADHIAFAIERMENNIDIVNPFSKDISLLYKDEYKVAVKGAKIIQDKLGVEINDDEISYITLHIHSALGQDNVADSMQTAMVIDDALALLEKLCRVKLNKESSAYARFLIHLKYMFYRIKNNEVLNLDMNEYAYNTFKSSFDIANEVLKEIEEIAKIIIPKVEIGYLAIHIERILND